MEESEEGRKAAGRDAEQGEEAVAGGGHGVFHRAGHLRHQAHLKEETALHE
ncbi:MAG: hypothetical protein IJH09_02980 [Clostridia bacterium]|nr:hypothetical protein [Clostridia bacterium]